MTQLEARIFHLRQYGDEFDPGCTLEAEALENLKNEMLTNPGLAGRAL